MINLGKGKRDRTISNLLLAFVQSWNRYGPEETSICSGTLDLLRAYLGDRPCCIWKKVNAGLSKVCERGILEIYYTPQQEAHEVSLKRVLASGASEFDSVPFDSLTSELQMGYGGFLNIPIKIQEDILGILTVSVQKKEAQDRDFVQMMECLCRLIAVAIQAGEDRAATTHRERKLRSEIEATTRELAHTNNRLIERVRELKTLSKELEKKVEELTLASRAKDEFLSVVSHELRTPLTALKGFLCVLLDEEAGKITEAQRKFLSIAKQSADRLNALISDLLDISRIESGRLNLNMDVCSLNDILTKSFEGLKSSAELKNIEFTIQICQTDTFVWGDSHRLQQVIDNLLSNAIKFTQHKGRVRLWSEDKGDGIQIFVEDNGPGIDPKEQIRIFDMFYQVDASTRRSTGGAGLGLAIANGIVSMHGGKLWVESERSKGSNFSFLIPRHKAQKAA